MRAFGRHVVMNSVTGVILSNHGFAVSFNNVSACRYSRGVVSRQFSRSPRESNQISPPKYYSTHRLRSSKGNTSWKERIRFSYDETRSRFRNVVAPNTSRPPFSIPRLDLRRLFFNRDADHRQRHSCRSVLSQQPLKYIVHGFCIARPTIREIKNACAHRGGEGGNFCFFVVTSKRIATYDAAMVNTGCNRDVIGQSCYRVAPWNRKKK